jgi:hypothetical protein
MNLDKIIQKIWPSRDHSLLYRQKEIAAEILGLLSQNGHPEAVVAGGAPRNWAEYKAANDLDIYIRHNEKEVPISKRRKDDCFDIFGKLKSKYSIGSIKTESTYDGDLDESVISNVHTFEVDDQEVQIIELDTKSFNFQNYRCRKCRDRINVLKGITPDYLQEREFANVINRCSEDFAKKVFDTFDFGICKVAQDKSRTQFEHVDFREDFRNKTFTLRTASLDTMPGIERLQKRLNKLRQKYPAHQVAFKSEQVPDHLNDD